MLADMDATATVGVRDMAAAREFYGNVLGLKPVESEGGDADMALYRSGNTRVFVYRSEYAGTNQATAITWDVGDKFDDIVAALQSKGARFEHYDMGGLRREGDVHVAGQLKIVWLKDPDGNILSINSA